MHERRSLPQTLGFQGCYWSVILEAARSELIVHLLPQFSGPLSTPKRGGADRRRFLCRAPPGRNGFRSESYAKASEFMQKRLRINKSHVPLEELLATRVTVVA